MGRWALGWACLIIGVLGLVLPIIPGIPLLVAGVALVGRQNIVVRWCEVRWRQVLALLLARTRPDTLAGALVRHCHRLSDETSGHFTPAALTIEGSEPERREPRA